MTFENKTKKHKITVLTFLIATVLISGIFTISYPQFANAAIQTFNDKTTFLTTTGATSATGPLPNLGVIGGPGATVTVGTATFGTVSPTFTFFIGTSGESIP